MHYKKMQRQQAKAAMQSPCVLPASVYNGQSGHPPASPSIRPIKLRLADKAATRAPMAKMDTKFFLNLDLESSEAADEAAVQQVFPNEIFVFSKDNSHYVENLKQQMDALDKLRRRKQ